MTPTDNNGHKLILQQQKSTHTARFTQYVFESLAFDVDQEVVETLFSFKCPGQQLQQ